MIDAAIASTTTGNLSDRTPHGGYGRPRSAAVAAALGMDVMKFGRTTRQTTGTVTAVNAAVFVNYGAPGIALFVNQIIIGQAGFSAGGDSGSLVVVGKGKTRRSPVGLLFAGSATSTVLNPIQAVLSAFGVTVDGQ